jgi:hypothetical protein
MVPISIAGISLAIITIAQASKRHNMTRGPKRSDSLGLSSEDRIKLVYDLASKNDGVVSVKECVCIELDVADFLIADTNSDSNRSYQAFRKTFSNLIVAGKAVQNNGYTTQIRLIL